MKHLSVLLFIIISLTLVSCTPKSYDAEIELLQKQIDEIKQVPTIKQELTPMTATIVSDDPQISSKIEEVKKNVFRTLQYNVVSSDSSE